MDAVQNLTRGELFLNPAMKYYFKHISVCIRESLTDSEPSDSFDPYVLPLLDRPMDLRRHEELDTSKDVVVP